MNLALVLLAREQWEEAHTQLEGYRAATAGGFPLALAVCHAGLVACAARSGQWADVQRHMATVKSASSEGLVHDVDLANLLQLAGSVCAAKGHLRNARLTLEMAHDQWKALGRTAQQKAVAEALEALD
jgi:hypothetical protein